MKYGQMVGWLVSAAAVTAILVAAVAAVLPPVIHP